MSFELKFFVCRHVSIYEDSKTVSVCLRSHLSLFNISQTLVIDKSMKRFSRVLQHGNSKIWKFYQKSSKLEFWLVFWLELKSWNHLSFVIISSTLAIDTSIEMSSRVLQHGNPKMWKKFQKKSKFEFWLVTKSWNHLVSSISVLH